jgi:hypothetical protein
MDQIERVKSKHKDLYEKIQSVTEEITEVRSSYGPNCVVEQTIRKRGRRNPGY